MGSWCVAGLESYASLVQHVDGYGGTKTKAQLLVSLNDAQAMALFLAQAVYVAMAVRKLRVHAC